MKNKLLFIIVSAISIFTASCTVNTVAEKDEGEITPVNPVDPIDPVDPVDPIIPVDPIDPVDPVDPIEPVVKSTSTISITTNDITTDDLKYSSGGFTSLKKDNKYFNFLLTYNNSNYGYFVLKTAQTYAIEYSDGGIYGSVVNATPLPLKSITIKYSTSKTSGTKPSVLYGNNIGNYTESTDLSWSSSKKTTTIDIENEEMTAFKIAAGSCDVKLYQIDIEYYDEVKPSSFVYESVSKNIDFNKVSVVSNPVVGHSYTINNKSYKYYTFDDVKNNSYLADSNSYTEPVDVANYVALFGKFPVNYCIKVDSGINNIFGTTDPYDLFGYNICKSTSTMNDLVNDKARLASVYAKTTGYMASFNNDYYGHDGYSSPLYTELDIDLTGNYTTTNRGVGRIVTFLDGLKTTNGHISSFYTDDHYQTFQLYNNKGGWNKRFNAEGYYCGYKW